MQLHVILEIYRFPEVVDTNDVVYDGKGYSAPVQFSLHYEIMLTCESNMLSSSVFLLFLLFGIFSYVNSDQSKSGSRNTFQETSVQ